MYDKQKRKYKNIETVELEYNIENKNRVIINSVMRDNEEIVSNLILCGYEKNNIILLHEI